MTILVPLTQGYVAIIDDEDAPLLRYRWSVGKRNNTDYATCRLAKEGKWGTGYLHRMVMERALERCLIEGEDVDHIDRIGLNNMRRNLRVVNASQNSANRSLSRRNTSGYKGVSFNKQTQKYCAYIVFNHKKIHLGTFLNLHDAGRAYNAKAFELQGQYAHLNVIDGD